MSRSGRTDFRCRRRAGRIRPVCMPSKPVAAVVFGVLLFAGAYVGSPFLAVDRFKTAAMSGDRDRLDAAVDFPAVREGLKSQASAALLRSARDDPRTKDNPLAGFGMMLASAVVEKMVDAFITPDGLAALVEGQVPSEKPKGSRSEDPKIDYDYEYVTTDRFRVRLSNRETQEEGPSFVFERRGLFTWKLVRLDLPESLLAGPLPPAR